jgi:DNA-binding MarR family transcriptional regulator
MSINEKNSKEIDKILEDVMILKQHFYTKLLKTKPICSLNPSNPEYRVLSLLYFCGPLPMHEISKRLYVSKPQLTALINRLTKDQRVERLTKKDDRRVIVIKVTEKGKKSFDINKQKIKKNIRKNLTCLTKKDIHKLYKSLENVRIIITRIGDRNDQGTY